MNASIIFQLVVLIFSIMIHEIAHGVMALRLGDDTAEKLGRLTLNPLKHIDPVGSIILPLFLVLVQSPFLIGWAKPVPYDPRNLKNPKSGSALIALAGPASNLIIAALFGLILRLGFFGKELLIAIVLIVLVNIFLAIFNLIPIPPLDGSKILFYFIPEEYYTVRLWLERYGVFILLLFIVSGATQILYPIAQVLFRLIVGNIPVF